MENQVELQSKMNAQGQAQAMAQIAMVREQIKMAKDYPRDFTEVHTKVMKACSRKNIAEAAIWKYPRGGKQLSGPSIRLAEVLAMNYGNMDFGIRELSQSNGVSVIQSYCMDLESNVKSSKTFEVPHSIMLKSGEKKRLTDQRDIYEHVANYGSRRLRACILQCLPADLIEESVAKCKQTSMGKSDLPIEDRVKTMVTAFDTKFQITGEMLAEYLGYDLLKIDDEGLYELRTIYQSLQSGHTKRSDFFKVKGEPETTPEGVTKLDKALDETGGAIAVHGENGAPDPPPPENVDNSVEKPAAQKLKKKKAAAKKKSTVKKTKPKSEVKTEPVSPMMQEFEDKLAQDSEKN